MSGIQMSWRSLGLGVLVIAVSLVLIAARSAGPETIPDSGHTLKIEEYFAGSSKAYGVLLNLSGIPQRYFLVDLLGTWDEPSQTLTLEEDFVFDDGEQNRRVWKIHKTGANDYRGTANDVIGEAFGVSQGNTFHWTYVLEVPYKGSTISLSIDDWLFLSDDNVLINRADMYKFGFKVGEIVISFSK